MTEQFPVHIPANQTAKDLRYYDELGSFYNRSLGADIDRLRAFTKYVPVAEIGRFLARAKLFELVLPIHGSIVECGVFMGGGLMTWATLSAILEPLNHVRKVIGFDSFEGFVDVSKQDNAKQSNQFAAKGALKVDSFDDLQECVRIFDIYRPLGHIPKVELVRGDAINTIPQYLTDNAHLVVSLLYLDFDLYAPTKAAIDVFLPRMPRGAVLAFDQLGMKQWPGETAAVLDSIGIRNLRIERFPFQPQISYAVLP